MDKLALMTGVDIPIPELQTVIHQPTIKDISYLGEETYFLLLQLVCFNKEALIVANPQGEVVLRAMNNFQIFMTLTGENSKNNNYKADLQNLFQLFFPGFTVQFLPRGIFFNNSDTKTSFTVDETNFDNLQSIILQISGLSSMASGKNAQYKPHGKKAAEIAAKLMRGRAKASGQKSEGTVFDRYVSILTVGLNSMSLNDCISMTVYQLFDLIERYGLYTAWDIDIKSRLAGGKPDDKPDDWMQSIH